jgi:hypothetical protein
LRDIIPRGRITRPRKVTLLGTVTSKRPEEEKAASPMRTTDLHHKLKEILSKTDLHEQFGAIIENP